MSTRYLDHNATTPLGAAAREAIARWLDDPMQGGNPSSQHGRGRSARQALEVARAEVGALVGAEADRVIFTSGGTEAAALGVMGLARRARAGQAGRTRILVGASEHPCVHGAAEALAKEGFRVERLAVDPDGRLADDALAGLGADVALVAVQLANHETGVVQPVEAIAARAREAGAPWFCDAVQAAGKVGVELAGLGASAVGLSSHKLYAPAGAGALVLAPGVDVPPLLPGGHQERGRRPGTEALLPIVAFGAAAREAAALLDADAARQARLREHLERGVRALGARIFGEGAPRLPNTTLCAWPGVSGQLLMIALDLQGIEVSTGAACSSGSAQPSAVLLAAGHPREVAAGALRVSLGRDTDDADVEALLAALPTILARVRARSG